MEYRADDNFFLFLCSRVRILGANELKDKMSLKLVGAISPTFIFEGERRNYTETTELRRDSRLILFVLLSVRTPFMIGRIRSAKCCYILPPFLVANGDTFWCGGMSSVKVWLKSAAK